MTVATAPTPLSYSTDGSPPSYPITWKYNAKSHVVVTLRSSAGVETVWVLTTNYTLTDPGDTGTLTPVIIPATGQTLVITLEPPNTQSSDIPLGGDFPSVTVEDGLDLAAQRDGKIEALFLRALRVPKTDTQTGSLLELPIDSARASTFLAFNASGKPIAAAGTSANLGPVSTFINTLLDDTTAADARTTIGALGTDFTALTSETAPDAADIVALGDVSASTTDKVTLTVLAESLRALAADKSGPSQAANYSISGSIAANALTVTLSGYDGTALSSTNKAQFAFRNATAATGTTSVVTASANLTLTISATSTMGTTNAVPSRLWVVLFNDAGTLRLGAINCYSSGSVFPLADDILASSTAEGGAGAADSAGVIYTETAVTAKAMRVLWYIESTQSTAGNWATTPSKAQIFQPGMKLPGDVVQIKRTTDATASTGTTALPNDNTIPQITEGDQFMSVAITPTSSANVLDIYVCVHGSHGTNAAYTTALFQDATANSLSATHMSGSAAAMNRTILNHTMVSATMVATTFRVRCGGAAGATFTFNGESGVGKYGGVVNSTIRVTEIMS